MWSKAIQRFLTQFVRWLEFDKTNEVKVEIKGYSSSPILENHPFFNFNPKYFDQFHPFSQTVPRNIGCIKLDHIILKCQPNPSITLQTIALFPLCGLRCFYEAMTPLKMAGKMNEINKDLSIGLKRKVAALHQHKLGTSKLWQSYRKSFNSMTCRAGALYTFENTIVLCCLDNCMQLTLNLLVTFKGH
ncbi:hypothetical protein Fcan01_25224 [Folsomia candida]|uniref:Uncharacterized protein n=1 Tax=Folsomia candida TaxID=158441 RepID=A0A226D3V6_FOLCA|nr:hypothetical protein Fcan01_25224 [Folsomia candida]